MAHTLAADAGGYLKGVNMVFKKISPQIFSPRLPNTGFRHPLS